MIDITILTKYTSQGASSRYRYFLFINDLLKQDVNIEIDAFLDTSYLRKLYKNEKKNKIKILIAYFKRIFVLMNSAENLIIEYEALPYVPYFIEKIFLKNKNYILNFDDNIWDNYKTNRLLKNKLDNLVKNAAGVIVANDFLKERVLKLNSNIIKIPTVLDLTNYEENEISKYEKFTLVWIGSPATYKYIKSHTNVFLKLLDVIDYKLVIIASKSLAKDAIDGIDMEFFDWSASTEVEILKKSHVGLMPLDDDMFSQGKSAFKIIQFMAAGLPVVASSIGENKIVVQNNITGFLAENESDWVNAISTLSNNTVLYNEFVNTSKSNAYEYSIQKYAKEFNSFIQRTYTDN